MDAEPTSVQSSRPRFDLGTIKKRVTDTLSYTSDYVDNCKETECPVYQNARPPPTRPLYGGALSHYDQVTPVIEPASLPHHHRQLYEVFDNIQEEEDEVTWLERVKDETDIGQVVSEMESLWREQMINWYRNDPVWKVANHTSNTARAGVTQHYRVRDGLLYATTTMGEDCLYILQGHGRNGATLRELVIEEIRNKGHHSADGNLRYTTEYICAPEIRKDFRNFVQQCELCQLNRKRTTLPAGDAMELPFPPEIFTSYAMDFMRRFTKLKCHNTVLVVVDRAVRFRWVIPTATTATAVDTVTCVHVPVIAHRGGQCRISYV